MVKTHPPSSRHCENCGKPLQLSPSAPHKRFCGMLEGDWQGKCRNEWHQRRQNEILAEARKESFGTD